jgi:hypothetical protein
MPVYLLVYLYLPLSTSKISQSDYLMSHVMYPAVHLSPPPPSLPIVEEKPKAKVRQPSDPLSLSLSLSLSPSLARTPFTSLHSLPWVLYPSVPLVGSRTKQHCAALRCAIVPRPCLPLIRLIRLCWGSTPPRST